MGSPRNVRCRGHHGGVALAASLSDSASVIVVHHDREHRLFISPPRAGSMVTD